MKEKTISIRVTEREHRLIKKEAIKQHRTISDYILNLWGRQRKVGRKYGKR